MPMLALLEAPGGSLHCFEFGSPIEPEREGEAHLAWVLADYDARRDEQWRHFAYDAAPLLRRWLVEARSGEGREEALIRALGWYGDTRAWRAIVPYRSHPGPAIRRAVANALGRLGVFDSIPQVGYLLRDADPSVREEAFVALGKFGKPYVLRWLEEAAAMEPRFKPRLAEARERIAAASPMDEDRLIGVILRSDQHDDVMPFVAALWERFAAIVVDTDRSPEERERAARTLGLARIGEAFPQLVMAASDAASPLPLRLECIQALGRTRASRALPLMLRLIDTAEAPLKEAAIAAIGQSGEPRVLEPLLARWDAFGGRLRPAILLAARRLCEGTGAALFAGWPDWPAGLPQGTRTWFLRRGAAEAIELRVGFAADWVRGELESPRDEARHDATLLLSFLGGPDDIEPLEQRYRSDSIAEIRWAAAAGYLRLSASARCQSML